MIENTKYFQTVVKQRRARNRILQLRTEDGSVIEDQKGIENLLVDHFQKSYEGSVFASFESILNEIQTLPIPSFFKPTELCSRLSCHIF